MRSDKQFMQEGKTNQGQPWTPEEDAAIRRRNVWTLGFFVLFIALIMYASYHARFAMWGAIFANGGPGPGH